MDCVQNSVEIGSIREAVPRILVLQVNHDRCVLFELGEDVVHTELIELGHVDELALAHLQKFLLAFENLAKEVLVDRRGRRHIVLDYKGRSDIERRRLTMFTQICEQI